MHVELFDSKLQSYSSVRGSNGEITHQILNDMSQNLTLVCHLLKFWPPANRSSFSASEGPAMLIQSGF
jgi:hypothetical protein